jgi:hypothetical protein
MTSLEKYSKLVTNPVPTEFPKSYIFKPEGDDFEAPFVRRYFVKKINDQDIVEVDKDNFKTISPTVYILTSVKWKLSGPAQSVFENGLLKTEGYVEFNKKQVAEAEKIMPGISSVLKF